MALVDKEYVARRIEAIAACKDMNDVATEILAEDTMEDAVCILAGLLVDNFVTEEVFKALIELCAEDNELGDSDGEPAAGRSEGAIYDYTEESCPGHVASSADPKVCRRCGTHIDSLRPETE